MTVTAMNDINDLRTISSDTIRQNLFQTADGDTENVNMFDSILNAAVNNINETNGYLSDQENEELKLAMGITENTHDLSIAVQKAETALQYTIAVRDNVRSKSITL